jgi:hypothetical protein
MTMQESDRQERLGGDAPVRFSARPASNGAESATRADRGAPGRAGLPRTIEFAVFAAGVIAVLVAAAIDSGFGAERAWTLVTVLAAAFILRRR